MPNTPTSATASPLTPPPLATFVQTFKVNVTNPREFRPEGKAQVYFSADAELSTPGQRWSTIRLTVRHTGPVPTGMQEIVLDGYDLKQGVGAARIYVP